MADYIGLESASGHILLEDGTGGVLLELQTVYWYAAVTATETVTITTAGTFLAPTHGQIALVEAVTITTSATATLRGTATVAETVSVTTTGKHFGLGILPPAILGDFILTPVAPDDFVLTPVLPGSFGPGGTTPVAVFTIGASSDAYVTKNVPASTAHTVTVSARVPTAGYDALTVAGYVTAYFLAVGDPFGAIDGFYCDLTLGFGNYHLPGEYILPPIASNTWATLTCEMEHVSGGTWQMTWSTPNGSLTPFNISLGFDETEPLPLNVGGVQSSWLVGEAYEVRDVEVRDAADTVVFSDDFSSGNFDAWDDVFGDVTIGEVEDAEAGDGDFALTPILVS